MTSTYSEMVPIPEGKRGDLAYLKVAGDEFRRRAVARTRQVEAETGRRVGGYEYAFKADAESLACECRYLDGGEPVIPFGETPVARAGRLVAEAIEEDRRLEAEAAFDEAVAKAVAAEREACAEAAEGAMGAEGTDDPHTALRWAAAAIRARGKR